MKTDERRRWPVLLRSGPYDGRIVTVGRNTTAILMPDIPDQPELSVRYERDGSLSPTGRPVFVHVPLPAH